MFGADKRFLPQTQLATRMLRLVAEEPSFALKGGTAINLFYRNLPRLSVDLDLVYLPVEERAPSLAAIAAALRRIAGRAGEALGNVQVHAQGAAEGKLVAQQGRVTVTVEVNTVLRGSVYPAERRAVLPSVQELFGDITAQVLAFEDVYAGKMVAALDRQHPRDLFDIMLLLDAEGVSERLIDAFVVYLASHDRSMAEVLDPREKDVRSAYEREFAAMSVNPVSLDQLLEARRRLVQALKQGFRPRHREFLRSVKCIDPDWSLLPVPHAATLPGIRWKLHNLALLRKEQPARHGRLLDALERTLEQFTS